MATTAALELILTLKGDAEKQFANLEGEIKQVSKAAKEAEGTSRGFFGGLTDGLGKIGLAGMGLKGIADTVTGVASAMVSGNAEMENYVTGFSVLLGGVQQAQDRMAELARFAAETPFELPEVAQASRVLQVFGGTALATGNTLKMVGDIASATGQPFGDVAMWVGRAYDAIQSGRPWGEAAQRLQEMGAMSGATRAKIEALQAEGQKGPVVWQAFTASMGQFTGMMQQQAGTFTGLTSTLQDDLKALQRTAMTPIFDALKTQLAGLVQLLESPAVQNGVAQLATGLATGLQTALPIIGNVAGAALNLAGTLSGPLQFALQNLGVILALLAITQIPAFVAALTSIVAAAGIAGTAVSGFTATLIAGGGLTEALAVLAGGGGLLATLAGGIAALVTPLGLVVVAVGALALAWNQDFLGMRTTFEPWVQSVADGLADVQAKLGHDLRAALGQSTDDWDSAMAANARATAIAHADINTELEGMRDDWDQSGAMIAASTAQHGQENLAATQGVWAAIAQTTQQQAQGIVDAVSQAGALQAQGYVDNMVKAYGTGQPAVDAYLTFLIKRHDLGDALAIMGRNSAIKFLNALVLPVASGLEKMANSFASIGAFKGLDQQTGLNSFVNGLRTASESVVSTLGKATGQWQGFTSSFHVEVPKIEADHKKVGKSAADLAAKQDAAARAIVGSQETIIRALESAGQQTGPGAKGIGQSLVTLMGVLKDKIPADMGFVKDAIVNTLQQANSAAPPTVQALHDRIVGILQQLREHGSAETKLFAQAALENIGDGMATATAKAAAAADKLDATILKAAQSAVQNLGKLGDVALDPKGNIADFLVQAMDAAKAATDGKMPQIAATITGWIDRINSDAPPKLDELYQAVVSQLQALAAGSDVVMAAWAKQMLAHFDDVTTGLAEKAAQAATQAGEAQLAAQQKAAQAAGDAMAAQMTRQLEDQQRLRDAAAAQAQAAQQLPSALEPALLALQQHTKSALDVLSSLAPLATQAAAAGMPGLAAVVNQYMDQARQGVAVDGQAMYQSLVGYLQQMAQSGDSILSTFAQNAIQHLQLAQQIQAAQQSLVPFQAAADAAAAHVAAMNTAVQDAQKGYSDLQGQVSAAKQAIQDFARAPLQGEGAFAQAMHANEQAVARVRLQMLDLQRAGVSSTDPRAQLLQRQLDRLQQEADRARLQNQLTIGDQRFNLEQQANTTPETSYGAAQAGIAAAKDQVAALTPQLQAAQDRLSSLTREQAAAQEASQAAAAALQAQQQSVQALTQALQNGQPVAAAYTAAMAQTQTATAQFATDTAAGLAPVAPAFDALFGLPGDKAGPENILNKLFSHEKGAFFKTLDDRTNEVMEGYAVTWSNKLQIVNERVSIGLDALKDTALQGAMAVGQSLVQGIQQPIDDAVSSIAASAAAAVSAAIEAARAAAGNPHSPSPTMAAKVGVPLAQGVVVPMQQATSAAAAAGAGLSNAAVSGAAVAGLPGGNATGAQSGGGITINVTGPSMADLNFWRSVARLMSIAINERPGQQLALSKAATP